MHEIKYYFIERRPLSKDVLTYSNSSEINRVEIISSQPSDKLAVFQERDTTYVLTYNDEYARVESFREEQRIDDLFIGAREDIEAFIGKEGLKLSPLEMMKRIARHLKK